MLFRTFDPIDPGSDVPDPYYGGDTGFEEVLAMVERTVGALVTAPRPRTPLGSIVTRQPLVAQRAEQLLGTAVVATAPVAGGDISTATRLRLSDGTTALMKTLPHAPADFFPDEAAGLRWLAEADGVRTPEVLGVDQECLIVRWIEPGKQTLDAATELGRDLAGLHATGAATFGREQDGYIGRLPLPNRPTEGWAEFYAVRRVLPYLKLARDRGAVTDGQAAAIEASSRGSPTCCPTSHRPGCTATSGTATCSGDSTAMPG